MRLQVGVLLMLACGVMLGSGAGVGLAGAPSSILVPVGGAVSAIVPDPVLPVVYAADRDNSRVLVVSVENGTILNSIPAAAGPSSLALDPSGSILYVAEQSANTIGVIDLSLGQRVGSFDVGAAPQAIAAGRPGRLYVIAESDPWFMTSELRVLDTTTGGTLVGRFFTDYFTQPTVAISPDANTLYVLSSGVGVQAVDVSTDTPGLGPSVAAAPYYRDLWVNSRGDRLYLGNTSYSLPSLTLLGQLALGATTVTTTPTELTIVSGNFFDPTISLWRESTLASRGSFSAYGAPTLIRVSPWRNVIISNPGGYLELDVSRKAK